MIRVQGFCPMGCGETLKAGEGMAFNPVLCLAQDCPDPVAAQKILGDSETEHLVQFGRTGFTVRHPLRERIDDQLLSCELHRACAQNPDLMGLYRARTSNSGWRFEEVLTP